MTSSLTIHDSRSDTLAKALYPLSTLFALWAFSGGDISQFWNRLPILAVAILAFALIAFRLAQDPWESLTDFSKVNFPLALGSGIICALPVAVFIILSSKNIPANFLYFHSLAEFKNPPALASLVLALILPIGWGMISYGRLSPIWGSGNVAMLEAITVGFGLQRLFPALVVLGMSYLWCELSRKKNLLTVLVSQITFFVLIAISLYL